MIRLHAGFTAPRFRLGWLLVALASINALLWAPVRWRYDQSLASAEITVDWEDVRNLSEAYRMPASEMLRQLRSRGITSVAVGEQTLSVLRDKGRVVVTSREVAIRQDPAGWRVPATYRWLVTPSPPDAALLSHLWRHLSDQGQTASNLRPRLLAGRGILLPASAFLLAEAPMGFDPLQVGAVREAGLDVVARLANPPGLTAARVRARLGEARQAGARFIILTGDDVLGYDSLLGVVSRELKRQRLLIGAVEFSRQRGLDELCRDAGGMLVRVHTVGSDEAAKAQPVVLVERYRRAFEERGIRVAYLRLLPQLKGQFSAGAAPPRTVRSALQQNLEYVGALARDLQARALPPLWQAPRLGRAPAFGDYPVGGLAARLVSFAAARALRCLALFTSGLGVLGAALLLLNLALDLDRRAQASVLLAGLAGVAALSLSPLQGGRALALGAACIFPCVAILWGGLAEMVLPGGGRPENAWRCGALALVRTSAITLLGALVVTALLNDWRFISKSEEFLGTKLALLLPLAVLGLAFAGGASPERVGRHGARQVRGRAAARLRRWLDQPCNLRMVAIAAVLLVMAALWIARSGNDSGLEVPGLEWKLRAALERFFLARPRTKEIFLGHPAVLVAVWLALRGQRRPATLIALLAAIGQIDLMNSFCQPHVPLAYSLWRSALSVGLGLAVGGAAVALLQVALPRFAPLREPLRPVRREVAPPELQRHWPRAWRPGLALGAMVLLMLPALRRWRHAVPTTPLALLDVPAPEARWPWPAARREALARGVTHWLDRASPDGTTLDLLEFDFAANPALRLELYDQDEDDEAPFDNHVAYWRQGVGAVTGKLNARFAPGGHGGEPVVAAWNGLFFSVANLQPRSADWASHVAPVVLEGRTHYNTGNHRWTFGVGQRAARPQFKVFHLPGRDKLAREFRCAAGGAQCLLRNGMPLQLPAYPEAGVPPPPQPVPSTALEAGYIPGLDFIRTSRVSWGWTAGSRQLYLLVVKEPDGETPSRLAFTHRLPATHPLSRGGWMLSDVQRFWLAMKTARGVRDAVNSDGGDVAQLTYRQPDRRYALLPPRFALEHASATTGGTRRLLLPPDLHGAPPGGTLMYWYIRDNGRSLNDGASHGASAPAQRR